MGYEPRMRGTRFRRPTRKKQTSRESKDEYVATRYYEPEETDPTAVLSNILNGIDHLGTQRFVLPPFNEHFQRWYKDIDALIAEFEEQFPEAVDQQYRTAVEATLAGLKDAFVKLSGDEALEASELATLHQQLTRCETELSRLSHRYNSQIGDLRKQFGRSNEKLRAEILSLDKERLNLLRKRAGVLQRLLGRPKTKIEQSNNLIQSKKKELQSSEVTLERSLQERRNGYVAKRKQLTEEQEALRQKLATFKQNRIDDALEPRKKVCEQLHQAITEAVRRTEKQSIARI